MGWGESAYEGDISMYGELKAFYKSWGNENPSGTHYYEIESRPCTLDEIGLGDDISKSRFYPAKSGSLAAIKDYANLMQCIDQEIIIKGNYQTYSAQSLSIQFVACDYINNSTCKSYEEIR